MDSEAVRSAALAAASSVVPRGTSAPDLTEYAEQLIPWITRPPAVRLDVTLFLDGRLIARTSNGGTMATNAILGTNSSVAVTVLPKDASDNTTPDDVTFSSSDTTGAILAGSVSADGRTWTGTLVSPGTVTVTATCPQAPAVPAYVATILVTTGPTTHLVGTVTVT